MGTTKDCIEAIQGYVDLGITHFVVFAVCSPDQVLHQYEVLAKEVIPQLRDQGR